MCLPQKLTATFVQKRHWPNRIPQGHVLLRGRHLVRFMEHSDMLRPERWMATLIG